MPLSLRPLLRARAALLESTLAPELVLLRREAAGEAEANWVVKREKTVFQASRALGHSSENCLAKCGKKTLIPHNLAAILPNPG
jgi:hypothetical protein